jgi:hypothetical protein
MYTAKVKKLSKTPTFPLVAFGGVGEEARHKGAPDLINPSLVVHPAAPSEVEPVAFHNAQELLADLLGPGNRSRLDKVVKTPRAVKLGVLPAVIHGQQGNVVA